MTTITTSDRFHAGDTSLSPLQTAVFAAEFVREREFLRHHVACPLDVASGALSGACEAVDALDFAMDSASGEGER
jgi:hypothetical protein